MMMAAGGEAIFEAIVFLNYFAGFPDPRPLITVICPPGEVLLLALLAVLAGAETCTDIARFGANKLDLLRRFRPFLRETPPHDRLGLNGIAMVERTRETGAKTASETRFYITSVTDPAERLGPVIRQHWAIENSLHWVRDMVLRDDDCRISTGHAPANSTTVKHVAHSLMRRSPAKDCMRRKRKVAAWDDDVLVSLIAQ